MTPPHRDIHVLYEFELTELLVRAGSGALIDVTSALENGRYNYGVMELLIGRLTGLERATGSDLRSEEGALFEVKSYQDHELHPFRGGTFQTAASCTFPANNRGPEIKRLLAAGNYAAAKQICMDTGFAKNDFYIYVNSAQWRPSVPLRYIVVPTPFVLKHLLSSADPRLAIRDALIASVSARVRVA